MWSEERIAEYIAKQIYDYATDNMCEVEIGMKIELPFKGCSYFAKVTGCYYGEVIHDNDYYNGTGYSKQVVNSLRIDVESIDNGEETLDVDYDNISKLVAEYLLNWD
jgi:hypothetical protein